MVEHGARAFRIIVVTFLFILLMVPSLAPGSEGVTYRSEPIIVEGDEGFADAGFSGNGTAMDPYVLSEMSINAFQKMHGIRISNTTAHFRLVGCTVQLAYSPDRDPLDLSASGSGILLINVTNAVVENYLGDSNVRGITVVGSRNVTVNDSRFNDNIEAGVHLVDCPDGSVKVTNSTFTAGGRDAGIFIEGCHGVTICGNTIEGGINGVSLGGSSLTTGDLVLNNTITGAIGSGIRVSLGTSIRAYGNNISGCPQGIAVDWNGNEISDNLLSNNTRGVLVQADDNLISNNTIEDGSIGVLLFLGHGNQVLNNTISRMDETSAAGVFLGFGEVSDARIEGNRISSCNEGIHAATGSGQEITGLLIANNSIDRSIANGTYLIQTASSLIINNSFLSAGGNGVYIGNGCHDLLLEGNDVTRNAGAGLYIWNADRVLVASNTFVSNVREGIYLDQGTGSTIHGNALLFNKDSGRQYSPFRPQAHCGEGGNNWSLGTGNLWADWLSPDENDDGIVDLPYNMSGGFQDPFPLTSISGLEVPADITPPEVIAHSPQGSDAEMGSPITITFSEDMNTSTVVVMVNDVAENGTWNDRTFTLDLDLEFESDYQIAVSGEDLSGNALGSFSWAFRTEDRDAQVTGRVVDENGGPLSGALIVWGEQEALTDANGTFSLVLPPGDHILNMSKEGYLDKMVMVHVEPGGDMVLEDSVLQDSPELNGTDGGLVLYAGLAVLAVIGALVVLTLMRRRR